MTTAIVVSKKYYAHELLGIKEARPLTEEEQKRAAELLADSSMPSETLSESYDASNAPSDGAIWIAFKNVDAEFSSPLKANDADSTFRKKGLVTRSSLIVTDTMVWLPSVVRHASAFDPTVEVSVPYSELERRSIVVKCDLPVSEIFHDMLGSLVIVAILSLFLVICLVLQFATILKLSRLDKMRSSFVSTMIHELKRPISTLKMCVSGLENDRMMTDEATKTELMSETRNALDNLSAYFSKLRDITFNNVEQIPLNIQNINLHDLFDTLAAATVVPVGKHVAITNDIDSATEVSADRSHLYNILNNLVENAVKYSGEEVEIKASSTVSNGVAELRVCDNGNGIPAADLRHVFSRFYRGRAVSGEQPGMGLGLAYVKLLVEAHGGEVSVESEEGKGTCLIIRLPQ